MYSFYILFLELMLIGGGFFGVDVADNHVGDDVVGGVDVEETVDGGKSGDLENVADDDADDDEEMLSWETSFFSLQYPAYLTADSSVSGVRSEFRLIDETIESSPIAFSIAVMPNQGGVNVAERAESRSDLPPVRELTIDGYDAVELAGTADTEAGPLFIFVTDGDGMSYIVEIQTVRVSEDVIDGVLESFKFNK